MPVRIQHTMDMTDMKKNILELKSILDSSIVPPILHLPDELLVEIFFHHLSDWDQCRASAIEDMSHYGWIVITHVCRRWRVVALNAPLLWTDVLVTAAPECIETVLARTASLPIAVEGSLTCSPRGYFEQDCPPAWKTALSVASRIQSLTITVEPWMLRLKSQSHPDWTELVDEQFPSLTTLELLAVDDADDALKYLPPMFKKSARLPALTTLTADMFRLSALKPLLSRSLQSLTLYNFSTPRSTWKSFMKCLSRLTSLETLIIDDPLPQDLAGIGHLPLVLQEPVTLPSLRSLKFHCEDDAGATSALFLRNLRLPARTQLHVEYGVDSDKEPEVLEIVELYLFMYALSLRLSGETTIGPPLSILTLVLFDEGMFYDRTEVHGWTAVWPIEQFPRVLLKKESAEARSFRVEVIGTDVEMRQAPLGNLKQLTAVSTLAIDCETAAVYLREGLGHLTDVTAIWVSGRSAAALLEALIPMRDFQEYQNVFFPKLELLHISFMSFASSDDPTVPTYEMEHLRKAVRELVAENHPLKKLILTECYNVDEAAVRDLAEYVEVDWDERVLEKPLK